MHGVFLYFSKATTKSEKDYDKKELEEQLGITSRNDPKAYNNVSLLWMHFKYQFMVAKQFVYDQRALQTRLLDQELKRLEHDRISQYIDIIY